MLADKQTEIDLPLLRIEDADAEKTPTKPAGIMSSISGVRRLQLGASSGGELPRYGVEVDDESSLALVKPSHSAQPNFTAIYFSVFFQDLEFGRV